MHCPDNAMMDDNGPSAHGYVPDGLTELNEEGATSRKRPKNIIRNLSLCPILVNIDNPKASGQSYYEHQQIFYC